MIDQDLTDDQRREHAAEYKRCGGGMKERCCVFLAFDRNGFMCMRGSSLEPMLRERVAKGTIGSRRMPEEPWPGCRLT